MRTPPRYTIDSQESPKAVPVPLKPEDIPSDLICAICMCLPAETPVITSCQHLFCHDCLNKAAKVQYCCPVDRTPFTGELTLRGSLAHRIWRKIPVKCAHHATGCAWTGTVADFSNHIQTCARSARGLEVSVAQLRRENRELSERNKDLEDMLYRVDVQRTDREENERVERAALQNRVKDLEDKVRDLEEEIEQKTNTIETLRKRPHLEHIFTGEYGFPREKVVHLSRLIASYLLNKPSTIDSTQIYSCVESCYRGLKQDYDDNPEFFYSDMRMLLSICAASTWFSSKQQKRINAWMAEQSWKG